MAKKNGTARYAKHYTNDNGIVRRNMEKNMLYSQYKKHILLEKIKGLHRPPKRNWLQRIFDWIKRA